MNQLSFHLDHLNMRQANEKEFPKYADEYFWRNIAPL